MQSGTLIRILPGLGVYNESVVVNRGMVLQFEGATTTARSHSGVSVSGTTGPAFDLVSSLGTNRITLRDLTIGGTDGIQAAVGAELDELTFSSISGTALILNAGSHVVRDVSFDGTVANGVTIAAGADLTARNTSWMGLTGTALQISGTATIDECLIVQNAQAIAVAASSGSLQMLRSTVADSSGSGVDNSGVGAVAIDGSILWNNSVADMAGVSCSDVSHSIVGTVDCTLVNGNLQSDPLFAGANDYQLQPGSPALDSGPAPSLYGGEPCTDLNGDRRLRDWDGDGLAQNDLGPYEAHNTGLVPGDVANLFWSDSQTLEWDAAASATEYHIYRDFLGTLGYAAFGTCRDDLDGNRTDTLLSDGELPAPGTAFFYLISAEDGGGAEGSIGFATCVERSNFSVCP
ncbi:MAG: right-handed parallel beta-helix repeat-containing protein [Acidobacteriota bacterium]|nr:right-handed parallel beta-helix repeat-containing protein [Acidobacteriota bacterium]MDH3784393.1 right-handed parallel beta-helix repeat-containing protein [Acidobacteriota bacterium]